jgi:hypothetical protein
LPHFAVITPIGVLGSYPRIVLHHRQVASIENPTSTFPAPRALYGSGALNQAEKCLPFVGVRGSSEERCEAQAVMPNEAFSRTNLKTPKAAAIAGMLFSLLTVAAFWPLWISVPADPQEPGSWLGANSNTVALGLNLVPFAGIAFLWFHRRSAPPSRPARRPVLCDRVFRKQPLVPRHVVHRRGARQRNPHGVRRETGGADRLRHVPLRARCRVQHLEYISDQDGRRIHDHHIDGRYLHGICTRWLAVLGYVLSLLLLFGSYYIRWSFVVFPLWVFLISVCILVGNLRRPPGESIP